MADSGEKPTGNSDDEEALWLTEAKPFAYLAVKKTDNPIELPFATGDEDYIRAVVSRWKSGEEPKAETDEVEEPELPLETSQEATLAEALDKAVAFACSQVHLIALASVAPTLFEHLNVSSNIFDPVRNKATPVEDSEVATVYPLDRDEYHRLNRATKDLRDFRLGVAALPNAALMSIVATFDALIVDLVAKMLNLNKSWLAKSKRELSYAKLAEASSIEDLISDAIADEIYQFSRGSHDEQARYIEANFAVAIKSNWRRWPDYIEVFERRNLIAHGEATFNKRYVSICSDAGHKGSAKILGEQVEVRTPYLRQALDILTEFAILLPFSVWRKLSDAEEEKAFKQLNEAAYNLISNGRYVAAERVLEFALELTKVKVPAAVIQQLTINRASALHHAGHKEQAISVLDGVDWSASSDLFQICMYSVRGDADQVARLLPRFAASEELNGPTFKQWPCFSFVREDDRVKEAFLKTYGEPLSVPAQQIPADKNKSVDTPGVTPEETVH